ncbi:hypothetical protein GQ55_1G136700 [Panicum hallii var. hallii]|uniref:Serine/threonine protein phosphatase 2A regulatory subunit n=1 Tax=Panicum hallii var. hallii TaxID=1504633 RepID=A0A2T7F582_9POAL|nr:hypothetical protein GQ55_1G136700 [Panicum hallii var. hallii]
MWKQFLHKLPRKSSASGKGDHAAGSTHEQLPERWGPARPAPGVKRMSSAVFPSGVVAGIEPLLPFKDVPNGKKLNLFVSKVSLCCVVFDFSDPNKNSAEKDFKRQALVDLLDYVESASSRFTELMVVACCRMVFPPNCRSSSSGGGEGEEEPMFDPAWPHLHLVYDLVLKFIGSSSLDAKVGKKYFDHTFIIKLLELFDSEDPRERDCLKTLLHRIYGNSCNIFYHFVFETARHNGIAELLEVFGSVISGFALPLKEEHKIFLWRVLIPLHKPKAVGVYLQQLTYCVTQSVEKEPKFASSVILGLLRYWPITNSQKEVMFLSEIQEVAERALFLWNNDHIVSLVAQNRQAINIQNHWNVSILNLTANVKKMLSEMDEELFSTCLARHKEDGERQASLEQKRRLAWERLQSAAAFQPVTGNTAVLVSRYASAW